MQDENYEPQINLSALEGRSSGTRHRQMFFGFVLLLTVLILLVIRYRTYWFDSLTFQSAADQTSSDAVQETTQPSSLTPSHQNTAKHTPSAAGNDVAASSAVQEAFLLPPLQVDVTYANGRHQTLVARDSAVHLSFSPETAEALVRPVQPIYPLLAQQSNVQGSVVLLARIGTNGGVDSVQVLSGPEILANAAVEAVKQWRFKPRMEAGQATSAETRITVNFTISTP